MRLVSQALTGSLRKEGAFIEHLLSDPCGSWVRLVSLIQTCPPMAHSSRDKASPVPPHSSSYKRAESTLGLWEPSTDPTKTGG